MRTCSITIAADLTGSPVGEPILARPDEGVWRGNFGSVETMNRNAGGFQITIQESNSFVLFIANLIVNVFEKLFDV